jgi:hippurate hydrolase
MSILEAAKGLEERLVRLRHALHQEPEPGLHNPRTQEKILGFLSGLPLEITTGTACTSVTAVLRGTKPDADEPKEGTDKPVVLLRADTDALPVHELSGVCYASRVDGTMHACGHDLHTAMLCGAAVLLAERRHLFSGSVVFMFQPGEEGHDGAEVMIREGVLEAAGRMADAAFGLHVLSATYPCGQFLSRPGPMFAAGDVLSVTVRGAGGHGSVPQEARDPVAAMAEMISALQIAITRSFDVADPVVLTVGKVVAGTRPNIIPETATFEGTVRTFTTEQRARAEEVVRRVIRGVAATHDVEATVGYEPKFPPTINDPHEAALVKTMIVDLFGEDRHVEMRHPLAGSDDFSKVIGVVPGVYVLLSAADPTSDPADQAFNHSPQAVFTDDVLTDGAALHAQFALSRLAELSHSEELAELSRAEE